MSYWLRIRIRAPLPGKIEGTEGGICSGVMSLVASKAGFALGFVGLVSVSWHCVSLPPGVLCSRC